MKRIARAAAVLAASATLASLTGCAHMSPEEQQRAREAFAAGLGGALAGAAAYQAAQPRYIYTPPPMPMPTRTVCRRSFGSVVCDTW
jgi:hypothetical protein